MTISTTIDTASVAADELRFVPFVDRFASHSATER